MSIDVERSILAAFKTLYERIGRDYVLDSTIHVRRCDGSHAIANRVTVETISNEKVLLPDEDAAGERDTKTTIVMVYVPQED